MSSNEENKTERTDIKIENADIVIRDTKNKSDKIDLIREKFDKELHLAKNISNKAHDDDDDDDDEFVNEQENELERQQRPLASQFKNSKNKLANLNKFTLNYNQPTSSTFNQHHHQRQTTKLYNNSEQFSQGTYHQDSFNYHYQQNYHQNYNVFSPHIYTERHFRNKSRNLTIQQTYTNQDLALKQVNTNYDSLNKAVKTKPNTNNTAASSQASSSSSSTSAAMSSSSSSSSSYSMLPTLLTPPPSSASFLTHNCSYSTTSRTMIPNGQLTPIQSNHSTPAVIKYSSSVVNQTTPNSASSTGGIYDNSYSIPVYYNTPASTPTAMTSSSTTPAGYHNYYYQQQTPTMVPHHHPMQPQIQYYPYPPAQLAQYDSNNNLASAKLAAVATTPTSTGAKEAVRMPSASSSDSQSEADQCEYLSKKEKLFTFTSKTNLYIRGLNENTTDKDLYEMCKKYGEIKSTKAIIEKQTNKCKGYGFVDYKNPDDAKLALSELKKEQKDVQLAKQREQDPTNLYFANLPADIDEKCLNEMLKSKFTANVSSTRIMRDRNGNSKGVGFARIDDKKLCEGIIQELNGKPFPENANKVKLLLVKLADTSGNFKLRHKESFPSGNFPNNVNGTLNDGSHYNITSLTHNQCIGQLYNYNGYPIQMYDNQHGATAYVAAAPPAAYPGAQNTITVIQPQHNNLIHPNAHPHQANYTRQAQLVHPGAQMIPSHHAAAIASPYPPPANMNLVRNPYYTTNPHVPHQIPAQLQSSQLQAQPTAQSAGGGAQAPQQTIQAPHYVIISHPQASHVE